MEQVNRIRAFSLMELLIATAICGLLTVTAVPSYQSIVHSVRQHSIQTQMLKLHLQQQQFLMNYQRYAKHSELTLPTSEYYSLSVTTPSNDKFTIQAKAKAPQKAGTPCDVLVLDELLIRKPKQCW